MLSYSMTFVSFFSFLSSLGLPSIVVREIIKDETSHDKIIGATFYLKLCGGGIAFILGAIIIFLLKPEDNTVQTLVTLMLFGYVFQSLDTIDYSFQSKVISKYTVISRNISFIMSGSLKVYFIVYKYELIYFALASLLDIAVSSVFMLLIYFKLGNSVNKWRIDLVIIKKLLMYSWPLMLSSFFIIIYMKIDQLMIEKFLDMKSVGIYSVAVRLSEAWFFVPTIIVSTVMPYFIKVREVDNNLYQYRLKQINTLMFWMAISVGVITTVYGENIINLLFGSEYKESYLALSLNIWAGVFVSIGLAASLWLISENLQIYRLYGTMIGVVLNIAGNYFLIPLYGISGAAMSTLITQGLGLWVVPLFFKPMREYILMSFTSILPFYIFKGYK